MKRQSLLVTIFLILSLLSMARPVAAAGNEPVGDQIIVYYGGSIEFPAEAAFYIRHGWVQSSEDNAIGIFDFELEVDGILRKEDFKSFSAVSGDPDTLYRLWVYNFPDGMRGTHTITGRWYAPCQYAVDWLGFPDPCATSNAKVETSSRTLTVAFVP